MSLHFSPSLSIYCYNSCWQWCNGCCNGLCSISNCCTSCLRNTRCIATPRGRVEVCVHTFSLTPCESALASKLSAGEGGEDTLMWPNFSISLNLWLIFSAKYQNCVCFRFVFANSVRLELCGDSAPGFSYSCARGNQNPVIGCETDGWKDR